MPGKLEIVRAALQAYVDKDREAIERVIGDPYTFTSPIDNALDRATYFDRCWPNSRLMKELTFVDGGESGDVAWVIYEGSTEANRFRSCEIHRVADGRIASTEVYFGWELPHDAPTGGFLDRSSSAERRPRQSDRRPRRQA